MKSKQEIRQPCDYDKVLNYMNMLFIRDGEVVDEMIQAGIRGWVVGGHLPLGILQEMCVSGAIPMRPGDTNSEDDRKARKELDQWVREWKTTEVTHVLVWDEMYSYGWLHSPVPLWLLNPAFPSEQIRSFWFEKARDGDPQAKSYRAAYIARTGRLPDTGPITGG